MSAIAILRANTLHLYFSDKNTPTGGVLPQIAVSDMEVINEEELVRTMAKIIPSSVRSPTSTVLVLGDELCFAQSVGAKTKEDAEKELLSLTPFTRVAIVAITRQKDQIVLAVNQDLYESVARSLTSMGYPVTLVVPWSYLVQVGITKGEIDSVTVKHVFDSLNSIRLGSWPYSMEHEQKPTITNPHAVPKSVKISWGWIIFGSGALIYGFFMYWFFIRA